MVFNFYALPCDFRTELRRRSLGSAGGMNWMMILCQAVLLTRYIKIAHPARTHRAPTAHSKNGVMRPRGLWSSISSMRPWEHLVHIFCVSFYSLWQDARKQNVLTGSANTQCFYCALHALRGCPVTKLTPWKCPYQRLHYVLHALRGCWVTQLSPCECPPSRFLPCSCFERTPGNKVHSLAVPTVNVSIASHML